MFFIILAFTTLCQGIRISAGRQHVLYDKLVIIYIFFLFPAYTDDIVNAVKKSRRAIVVLSPSYVNGPALFELETAVNTVLEDKAIKLILIQFKSFQEPQSLPHNVKIALRVLPRVTWKTSTSPTVNKQFWRKLLRLMPAKHPNRTEDKWCWFPHLRLLGTDKKNSTAGRTNWTKKWRKIWERTSLN